MSWCCFHARKRHLRHSQKDLNGFSSKNIKLFSYNELGFATDNFHPRNRIGRGGFGTVFKGILKNGKPVAAKVLSAESKQGVNEFLTEIDTLANVRHPNLVELIGCCVQGSSRVLIYEYVENNSLDRALLGPKSEAAKLNWVIRAGICLGTARGLAFLHDELEPHIVHRDIKASNILLDKSFAPKIGDFGLAKLFPDNITHISTRVAGTTGYLAPEYAMQGQLTKKADIYSFGVLVLEIISGRSSSKASFSDMEKFLLEWTWQLYKEGRLRELVDSSLTEYPEEQVFRYIKVALFCTQGAAARRPSINKVVDMLSKPTRINDKELTPPGLIDDGTSSSRRTATNNSSSSFRSSSTLVPFTHTEMVPR